jgi:hypothetical protein
MMLLWMILSLCTVICITANCFSLLRWNDIWSKYHNPLIHAFAPPMDTPEIIHVLIYETEATFRPQAESLHYQLTRLSGVDAMVFGPGTEYQGYGSKYAAGFAILQDLPAEDLVVLTDSRDVFINNPFYSDRYVAVALAEFREQYDKLTHDAPQAIILSAETQCCVSALTHAVPQDYFHANGTRHHRACHSGAVNCGWAGDPQPWEWRMQDRAQQEQEKRNDTVSILYEDMYLNAGLMVGTVENLIHLINAIDLAPDEDDQAVLTDYMLLYDDRIRLDYGQALFGNNRADFAECVFSHPEDEDRLVHTQTKSTPLFIHSPGGYFRCHDRLSMLLGIPVNAVSERQLAGCNYGRNHSNCETGPPDGNGDGASSLAASIDRWIRRIIDVVLSPIRRWI